MNEVTEQEFNSDKFVDDFMESQELAARYLYLVAEFTTHKSCYWCLVNAIMEIKRCNGTINNETVLAEYITVAATHGLT